MFLTEIQRKNPAIMVGAIRESPLRKAFPKGDGIFPQLRCRTGIRPYQGTTEFVIASGHPVVRIFTCLGLENCPKCVKNLVYLNQIYR